ncbi:cytochrome P450 oxidoreductase [Aspergillus udagawae]|nr:cytochrome P450 oxidoreductase [Aspergillus udagawae]
MAVTEDVLALIAQPRTILLLSLLGIIIYTVSWVTGLILDPLRSAPGPTATRYTALWYFYRIYKGEFHRESIRLHEKHGKIVRIAPNMYSIDDIDAAKTIYGHGTQFFKADWYSAWTTPAIWSVNLFAMQDAKGHGVARRQFANYYSMSSMVHYEGYVDDSIQIFQGQLEAFSRRRRALDMGAWLQYYAFDVITNITFGKAFGYLDKAEDINNMIAKLDQSNLYSALMGLFPSAHAIIVRLGEPPGQVMVDYIKDLISQQTAKSKAAKDDNPIQENNNHNNPPRTESFLGKFRAAHDQDPSSFTSTHLLFGCLQNVFAGSDTTAIGLSSIIFHLTRNPTSLSKLREEINAAAARGIISDPITFAQSQTLPYLQAVIKEALRINPAVGLPLLRVVPAGGAMLCGVYFPEGTVVGINPWVAHYNKSVFGADADVFKPERWLQAEGEDEGSQTSTMERYFLPFGLGSRTCIGKNISLLEIGKLVPQLVRNFDFELVSRQDALVGLNHWFVKPHGFEVVPRKLD